MRKLPVVFSLLLIASCNGHNDKRISSENSSGQFHGDVKKVIVFTTADSTSYRLTLSDTVIFGEPGKTTEKESYIFADPQKTFQVFLGIGGALTDAAAETFAKLPPERQQELLIAYYDRQKGIGYTLGRTNINSCDFSSSSYTYIDEGDKDLKTFSIIHDRQFKIPLIKKAIAAAGGKLTILASPWSPPAFMKDNNNMLHGGKLKPGYYQSWAEYFVKFIRSYENEGIPIWGITVQNEPMAVQTWESCIFNAEDERDFLKNYLGPTMVKEGLADKKILVWDHNRDLMVQRARVIFDDPEASKYAWGLAFHWYEDWSGGDPMFTNTGIVKQMYPDKNLLLTEACTGDFSPEDYYDWDLGEKYGRSMINDFNNGAVGWTDWNILLDEKGGPNHLGNYCFAPVHGDTRNGNLIYTNTYYYIGHFSKFIRPGARRIACASSRSQLLTTGFINEDGSIVVVVMNDSEKGINYNLSVGNKVAEVKSPPHSIQTLLF